MYKQTFSLFLFLGLVTSCLAMFVETRELKDIKKHLRHEHDWVICDLDNTLVKMIDDRGRDQWFDAMINYAKARGVPPELATAKILQLYFSLHLEKNLQLTEVDAHELIIHLQAAGKKVIALTLRSLPLKDRTVQQLAQLNIAFSKIIPHDEVAIEGFKDARYAHGILFCSGNNKGDVLMRFLDQQGHAPRSIIFVDDKKKYLDMVQKHAHERKIEFLGFRYGGCDEEVASFMLSSADKDWIHQQFPIQSV